MRSTSDMLPSFYRTGMNQTSQTIPPGIAQDAAPVHSLVLPAIRSEIAFPNLAEEGRAHSHFFQFHAQFQAQEPHQVVNRRDLDVVQYHPTARSDLREKIRKLQLRKWIGMRAIQQCQIQAILKAMQRKRAPGFAFDEDHGVRAEAGILAKPGNGTLRALDRESGVMFTHVR